MTQKRNPSKQAQAALVLGVTLFVAAAFVFVIVFIIGGTSVAPVSSSADGQLYAAEVAAALEGSVAATGATLAEEQNCGACHVLGDGTVAPLFRGIADRAAEQRPPLSAEQYLYEAIMYPGVYVLEPYPNSMPDHYDERLSQQEIGHIIAYLLTLSDEADNS